MTKKDFEARVEKCYRESTAVLFETSYAFFWLNVYDIDGYEADRCYNLEMCYKYAVGLDKNLRPIYQYQDGDVWSDNFYTLESLFECVKEILRKDPYGKK